MSAAPELPRSIRERRLDVVFALAAAALKIAASIAIVELAGFRQISDDDYARTVIAQSFAHAPALDPSGTSWLPFPFWLTGGAMLVFGRSLAVARGVGYVASAAATAAFFAALRAKGLRRGIALAATLVAALGAWSLWVGAAPVPEGFAAGLMAIGALGLVDDRDAPPRPPGSASAWAAAALFAATLSRYEAWPLAAVFALVTVARAPRSARAWGVAALAAVGPLAWMAWNAHAHGSALHFVTRVTRYRQMIGAAGAPLREKLFVYPTAFLRAFPDATLLALVAAAAFAKAPRRFAPAMIAMLAVVAFLVVGELGEGAPTHHPERALVGVAWFVVALAGFGFDAARDAPRSVRRAAQLAAALGALVIVMRLPFALSAYPGQGEADRRAQLDRGTALRDEGAPGLIITPCAYEHFALIAAYRAPERTVVTTSSERRPVTETCPTVEVRR